MSITQRRRSSVIRQTIITLSPVIKSQINFERVVQAINEEGMFTTDQLNVLCQRMTPEDERKTQLLEFVCQHGEEGIEQFVRCLRESGHTDLANTLQTHVASEL